MIAAALIWGIGLLISSLILICLTAMCSRLYLTANIDSAASPVVQGRVGIIGGLLTFPLPIRGKSGTQKEKLVSSDKKKPFGFPRLKQSAMAGRKLIIRVLGLIRIEPIEADIHYGFADPADTGMMSGLIMPLTYAAPALRRSDVVVTPDYRIERFDGYARLSASFIPIRLAPPLLAFVWAVFVRPRFAAAR